MGDDRGAIEGHHDARFTEEIFRLDDLRKLYVKGQLSLPWKGYATYATLIYHRRERKYWLVFNLFLVRDCGSVRLPNFLLMSCHLDELIFNCTPDVYKPDPENKPYIA